MLFSALRLILIAVCFATFTSAALAADEGHGGGHDAGGPLAIRYDTAIWTVIIFVALYVILRRTAWKQILEGLQKREETIRTSLEEAKMTRAEMERMRTDFRKELEDAHQKIPTMMEEARKKAEALSTEMQAKASAAIQEDRQRLRHELEVARDQALKELWEQTAQLATLISAKAIGRSLSEEDHRRLIDEALQEMKQVSRN
jgi:F-type H+-transporting ATPase subunit b